MADQYLTRCKIRIETASVPWVREATTNDVSKYAAVDFCNICDEGKNSSDNDVENDNFYPVSWWQFKNGIRSFFVSPFAKFHRIFYIEHEFVKILKFERISCHV